MISVIIPIIIFILSIPPSYLFFVDLSHADDFPLLFLHFIFLFKFFRFFRFSLLFFIFIIIFSSSTSFAFMSLISSGSNNFNSFNNLNIFISFNNFNNLNNFITELCKNINFFMQKYKFFLFINVSSKSIYWLIWSCHMRVKKKFTSPSKLRWYIFNHWQLC